MVFTRFDAVKNVLYLFNSKQQCKVGNLQKVVNLVVALSFVLSLKSRPLKN